MADDKDHEALHAMDDEEARRKKRRKWTIGIIAFVIFQVVQGLFFVLVIMKFRSPKFRIAPPDMIQTLTVGTPASPSFDMSFMAPIQIKNTNWGPFKYDATTIYFTSHGVPVGQVYIPKSKANFKSTKKIDVGVYLKLDSSNSTSNPGLGIDLSSGVISLNSGGEITGKVTVMFMFKKKKTSVMDCSMTILVPARQVLAWACN
ncbi:uncharacterized protein LOC115688502 [Syzygium oleosum]|uniref:uncharacterized protein LOC115688502 n=1 Tax=Syzygium oleosum TaxID=219896 RepID=UPI0011D26648|nr:uncharacterized protein LOC115688502 [Syzygium oleosum]